ncbi:MAG: type 4a pilus biogenesis protein PilO [bacterium]
MNNSTRKYNLDLRRYYRIPAVQTSLTLVLSLFVMTIFLVFALRPTIVSIVTLKKTIIESESKLEKLDAKVLNLQKAATQLESVKSFLPTLNTNIPNGGAMYSPLSSTIEALSIQNQTQLDSESLGPTLLFSRLLSPFVPNKNQSVVLLPFNIRIVGDYNNVNTFLTKLLSMERIITIDTISIEKEVDSKNEATNVALNISGNAYYLADEALLEKSMTSSKGSK